MMASGVFSATVTAPRIPRTQYFSIKITQKIA
jgi:hypothetical protein